MLEKHADFLRDFRGDTVHPSTLRLLDELGLFEQFDALPHTKLEGWGIGPATPVAEVSIKVSAATGAQLKELLKKLPDGMTFELSLEKEDK